MTTRTRLPFRLLSPEAALPVASVPGSPVEGVPVSVLEGGAAAAGQQAEGQGAGQEQGCELLHGAFLLFIVPQREVVFPNQSTKKRP